MKKKKKIKSDCKKAILDCDTYTYKNLMIEYYCINHYIKANKKKERNSKKFLSFKEM